MDHSPGFLKLVAEAKKQVDEISVAEARAKLDAAPAANQSFTVDYATSSGTADGNDYMSAGPATLTFGPGQQSATVTVRVFGDFTPEADETFFVNLSNPTLITNGVAAPGHLSRTQATGVILNDDTTSLSASMGSIELEVVVGAS